MGDKVKALLKYDQVSRGIRGALCYSSHLRASDIQLKNAQCNKQAFDNFVEHQISHIP
jgi:hypothetical protein